MDEANWPREWLRGVLGLCILAVIAEAGGEGTYGYAIAQCLQDNGLGTVKGGTLYPILNRLEQDGLVRAKWIDGDGGPGRKTFTITHKGQDNLNERSADWLTFTERATDLVTTGSRGSTA